VAVQSAKRVSGDYQEIVLYRLRYELGFFEGEGVAELPPLWFSVLIKDDKQADS
jgi:hypothetical protein